MKVSLVEPKDFEKINQLIEKEFPYTKKSKVKAEKRVKEKNVFLFKLEEKNEFIGFIDVAFQQGTGWVYGLVVKEEFRNKGFGKKLLDHALNFLRSLGAKEARLFVKEKNLKAKRLYQSFGFTKERELEKRIENEKVEEMVLLFEKKLFTPNIS
jgi:ribosomal protein S18 acetylase RimI-like enzyme